MDQPQKHPEGFCPACGEPQYDGKLKHTDECPFAGDDLPPEDGVL